MDHESSSKAQIHRTPTMATAIDQQSQSAYHTGVGSRRTGVVAALSIGLFIILISVIAWQAGSGDGAETAASQALEPSLASGADADAVADEPVQVASVADAGGDLFIDDETKPEPPSLEGELITITAVPETAEIYLDGDRVGIGYYEDKLVLSAGVKRTIEVRALGYHTLEQTFSSEPPSRVFRLNPRKRKSTGEQVVAEQPPKKTDAEPVKIASPPPEDKKRPPKKPARPRDRDKDNNDKESDRDDRWKRPRTDNRNPFKR
jgi:hypothetical protein